MTATAVVRWPSHLPKLRPPIYSFLSSPILVNTAVYLSGGTLMDKRKLVNSRRTDLFTKFRELSG
jgi:hypothetical protein